MERHHKNDPDLLDQQPQDDQRRITWREFLILCGVMYRQILPGVLLLSGAIILVIIVLLFIAG